MESSMGEVWQKLRMSINPYASLKHVWKVSVCLRGFKNALFTQGEQD